MAMSLYGGIWLELNKHPACDRPIESMPAPRTVYLPLRQHEGNPCVPTVKVGDAVKAGETIAAAGEGVSCPLQSPVSGTVREIAECSMPTGAASTMIVIDSDEREREYAHAGTEDTDSLTEENILDAAKDAGIASVSVFGPPLWARLEKMRDAEVDTLIINAVETEPYICSSQKIIDDYPDEVALGMSLMMRCVGADKGMLAVSDDIEPSVIDGMLESAHLAGPDLKLERIHQKYPSGFERYLIGLIKENRKIRDPLDVKAGFVYPEECMLLARMVTSGHPQTAKVITVSGDAVGNPQTMEVPLGTPVRDVLEHCGLIYDPERVVLGSPMRGVAITNLATPVTKQVTAVLALTPTKHSKLKSMCINCGKCVKVCPENLMPNYISMRAVIADIDACRSFMVSDCIECGACAYVCPGRVPIVELIKNIKKAVAEDGNDLE
jgi:electron transport complex protein RnfC